MSVMAQVCGFTLCAFLGALCATIIAWIWMGKIDLSQLISEPSGDASMSRFQLLIFTFVIAISLFVLVEANHGAIPDIPTGVLTLLGISASTYAVSKGISYSQPQLLTPQAGSAADTGGVAADAQAAADEASEHAAAAQQAAAATQAAVSQMAAHAAAAQQAVQQTAENAAKAQQAADKATGNLS
jgi:hypothetical protein